ncbi:hypothetical protein [Streptomyces sp. NPDC029554]|uniref:hypothetical protein n=1 Tax=Streptomyces sp. NPDC029554 TaxID=3155126 RepID=UPI0033FFD601
MSAGGQHRAAALRSRAALLSAAQRHFLACGAGRSLEAVAKEAGVGPARRSVPALPHAGSAAGGSAATRAEELVTYQAEIARLGIRHPPSAIRHPPSPIRHPASGIRHPASG